MRLSFFFPRFLTHGHAPPPSVHRRVAWPASRWQNGGGVLVYGGGSATFADCEISGNRAENVRCLASPSFFFFFSSSLTRRRLLYHLSPGNMVLRVDSTAAEYTSTKALRQRSTTARSPPIPPSPTAAEASSSRSLRRPSPTARSRATRLKTYVALLPPHHFPDSPRTHRLVASLSLIHI